MRVGVRRTLRATPGVATLVVAALAVSLVAPFVTAAVSTRAADTAPTGVCLAPPAGEVNTSWPLTANATAGATTLTISNVAGDQVGAASGVPQPGDMLLISQVMDATIDPDNDLTYGGGSAGGGGVGAGTGTGYTSLGNSGLWEYARVVSYNASTGVVALNSPVTKAYRATGFSRAQVTRVREYTDLTLTASLTAPAQQVVSGDRVAGGVLAIVVSGTLNLNGFNVHADARGFPGGDVHHYTTAVSAEFGQTYVNTSGLSDAQKGWGIAGTVTDLQNSLNGSHAQGAPANGGGGGGDSDGAGAGGGNGGAGGTAGPPFNGTATAIGGVAIPIPAGETLAQRLIMGGGGGGGNGNQGTEKPGGAGGGVVVIQAGTITNTGTATAGNGEIRANGAGVAAAGSDASGGGGAGGTILVRSSAAPATVDFLARGGTTTAGQTRGTGAAGGGGRIAYSATPAGAVTVTKGTGGAAATNGDGLKLVAAIPAAPNVTITQERTCEFGDLPDSGSGTGTGNYQTLADDGYAAHNGVGVRLGADRNSETEAPQNTSATADFGDDGVTLSFIPRGTVGITIPVSVQNVTTTSCLVGYLDRNSDGDFADTGESSVGVSNITTSGTQNLVFSGGTALNTLSQMIGLRVRVTSDATFCAAARTTGARSIGYAADGEIEDYLLPVAAESEMAITKTLTAPASGTVVPGGAVGWAITVTNNGPTAVSSPGFTVADTVPALVSGTWSCTVVSGTATCPSALGTGSNLNTSIVAMASGAVMRFTFTGTANVSIPAGTVSNTATVNSNSAGIVDTNTANNSATTTSPVQQTANLKAEKSGPADSVAAGTTATFTLTATNNGPHAASNVTLTDSLPPGFTVSTLTSATPGATCNAANLSCTVGSLPNTEALVATLVANIPPGASVGSVTNSMVASTSSVDPDGSNNSANAPVSITHEADLKVEIQESVTGTAGQNVSVPVTVTNNGPSTTTGTVMVPVPVGLTFSPGSSAPGCTASGGSVSCATGTLAKGETANFSLAFSIPPAATGTINASATVTTPDTDPNAGNNTDAGTITIAVKADLGIAKLREDRPIIAGETATWTITVINNGPSTATGLTITDVLPVSSSTDSLTVPPGASCPGNSFPCTAASLAPGSTLEFTLVTKLDQDTEAGTEIVNTASVNSTSTDPVSANNSAADSGTSNVDQNVSLGKAITPGAPETVFAGENSSFDITVTNDGTSQTSDIEIVDTLPTGLTLNGAVTHTAGASCTVSGQEITCTAATLAAGADVTVTVPVTVSASAPAGTIVNTAKVTYGTADPVSVSSGLRVQRQADVSITKALKDSGPKAAGAEFDIVLTANNAGPSTATNVTVIDTLPGGMSFVKGAGCTADGVVVTCAPAAGTKLAVGSTDTYTVTVVADSHTPAGPITNSATVSADEDDPDHEDADTDNAVTLPIEISREAKLSLTKVDSVDPAPAGSTFSYTLTATNAGPSTATGVVVTDTLPVGLAFVADGSTSGCVVTAPAGSGFGQEVTCPLTGVQIEPKTGLPVGVAVRAGAALDAGTTVTNTADVTGAETDTDAGDNHAEETTQIAAKADLTIAKTITSGPLVPGSPVVWQVQIENTGPSVAHDVTITDALDPRVTFVADDPGAAGDESSPGCAVADGVVTCTVSSAMAVGTQTVQIVGQIAADATGTLSNTATLSTTTPGSCLGGDPCASTVAATLAPQAGLSLQKTVLSDQPLVPGGTALFQLAATNAGPSVATDVVVTDTLASGLTFVASQSTPGCSATGDPQKVTCAIGSVAAGTRNVQIAVAIAPSLRGSIDNTATASSPTSLDCTEASPCSSAVEDIPLSPRAQLVVHKSTATFSIVAGGQVVFDVVVDNTGASDATGVVISDTLAAGLTFVNASTGCTASGQTISCDPVTIVAGGQKAISITATLASGFGDTLENTATAASADDPNCGAGCAGSLQPEPVTRAADLKVSAGTTTIVPGGTGNVTLTVTNLGPSDVSSAVTAKFTAPAGTTVAAPPTGCTREGSSQSFICSIAGPFARSATVPITVPITVPAGAAADTTLGGGSAEVSSATTDTVLANNADDIAVTVGDPSVQLAVIKKLSSTPLVPGTKNSFTVAITNNGPSNAAGVTIADTLDSAFTFDPDTSTTGCTATGQQVSCQVGTIPVGDTTVTIGVTVNAAVRDGVSNTATLTTSTAGNCADGCAASAGSIAPTPVADVSVVKKVESSAVVAGQPVEWLLTIRNGGPSTATAVTVTDTLDARLTFVPFAAGNNQTSTAGCAPAGGSAPSGTISCVLGELLPNTERIVKLVATLAASATGTLSNTASVSSADDVECASGCASNTTTSTVDASANLALTSTGATIVPGDSGNVVVKLDNLGPSDAAGPISFVFTPPTGTVVTSAPASCAKNADGGWGCTLAGPLAVSADPVEFTFAVAIPPDHTGTDPLTAHAEISASATADPVAANNETEPEITVGAAKAALTVTKALHTSPLIPGQRAVWTVTVRNTGPSVAQNIMVTDTLEASLSFIPPSATDPLSSDDACTASGQVVTCTAGSAALGDTRFQIATMVASGADDPIGNAVSVRSPTAPDCEDGSCSGGTGPQEVSPDAQLSLTKTLQTSPLVAGKPIAYAVTVANRGPSDASAVTVTDTLPAEFIYSDDDSTDGCTWVAGTTDGGTVTCSVGTLADESSVTLTIAGTLASNATGTTSNTATVRATGAPVCNDANDGCSSASGPHAISTEVDAKVAASEVTLVPGTSGQVTVSASNAGPSDAVGAAVVYAPPAGLSVTTIPDGCVASGNPAGSTYTCLPTTLIAGANAVAYQFGVALAATQDGPTTLTGSVAVSGSQTDSNRANNAGPAVVNVEEPNAPLTITKALTSSAPLVPGQTANWQITVSNAGPSAAKNVVVTDELDADLTPPYTLPAGCELSEHTVMCTAATLMPGAANAVSYSITATIAPTARGELSNSARVESDTSGDCTGSCSAAAGPHELEPKAPVTVVKSQVTENVVAGSLVSYELKVTNPGPSAARSVVITDVLDSRLSFTDTGSSDACAASDQTVTCTLTEFTGETTLLITATLDPSASGTLSNTATFTSAEQTCEPSCSGGSVESAIVTSADLAITASSGPITPGASGTMAFTVANAGPSTAVAPTVTITLPAAVTPGVMPSGCGYTAGTAGAPGKVICELESLAPASPARTITFTASVPANAAAGSVTGTAEVSSPTPDLVQLNNARDLAINIGQPQAQVSIEKELTSGTIVPGQPAMFTITVTNAGPSTAAAVTVTDTLPAGLRLNPQTSDSRCAVTDRVVTCTIGAQGVGETTIPIGVDVDPSVTADIANTARVSTSTAGSCSDGCEATSGPHPPMPNAGVSIIKEAVTAEPVAGKQMEWLITVRNDGPSTGYNLALTDTVAAVITGVAAVTDTDTCQVTGQRLNCGWGTFPVGEVQVRVTGMIVPDASGTITNSALLQSPSSPMCARGCIATVESGPIAASADVAIAISAEALVRDQSGDSDRAIGTIHATVSNNGPSAARGPIMVTMALPAGAVFADMMPAGCARDPGAQGREAPGGETVVCTLVRDLAVGDVIEFDLPVVVANPTASEDSLGEVLATVTATYSDPSVTDPVLANNTDDQALSVADAPPPTPPVPTPTPEQPVVLATTAPALGLPSTGSAPVDGLIYGGILVILTGLVLLVGQRRRHRSQS